MPGRTISLNGSELPRLAVAAGCMLGSGMLLGAFLLFGREIHDDLPFFFGTGGMLQLLYALAVFHAAKKLHSACPLLFGMAALMPLCGFLAAVPLLVRSLRVFRLFEICPFKVRGGIAVREEECRKMELKTGPAGITVFLLGEAVLIALLTHEVIRFRILVEQREGVKAFVLGDYGRAVELLGPTALDAEDPEYASFYGAALLLAPGDSHNPKRAVSVLQPLIDQTAMAAYGMAMAHLRGLEVPYDPARAVELLEKALEKQLFPAAQVDLGAAYLHGLGVPADPEKGFELIRQAAETGNGFGILMLGRCHAGGWGVPADPVKAVECYRQAAEAGSQDALYELGNCFYYGFGVPQDRKEGLRLLNLAAGKNVDMALNQLGIIYLDGDGVEPDWARAERYFRQASRRSNPLALTNLGNLLLSRPEQAEEGFRCLEKAAAQNEPQAVCSLGVCYAEGIGTAKDAAKALECFRRAEAAGVEWAAEEIRKLEAAAP